MLRPLALFLTVGLFSSAVVLTVPDDRPRLSCLEPRAERENRTAGAILLDGAGSIGGDSAPRASALAGTIRPRRFDEVVREELILEVLREDGRPIAGAAVVGSHDGTQFSAMTDAAGQVVLRAYDGDPAGHEARSPETELTVSRSDFVALKRSVRLDPGVQRFVVPTGSSLTGRVQVRGSTPREPMGIGLACGDGTQLLAISDSQGHVEFFNLPADWSGTLNPPQEYRRNYETPVFVTTGVPSTWFARPHRDDGQPYPAGILSPLPAGILTPMPTNNRIANVAVLGVPGDIEVSTFLNPGVNLGTNPGSSMAEDDNYQTQPFEKPGITIVDLQPPNPPPPIGFSVHDVGIINLIPMRAVKIRILDGSGTPVADVSACAYNGSRYWYAVPGAATPTLWVDADKRGADLGASLRVLAPSIDPAWMSVDGERVVLTETGNDEITVTLRGPSSVPAPETSPIGTLVPFDVTSDQ